MAERATETIPECEVLAVIARIEEMMVSVVCRTIDHWPQKRRHLEVAVMDRHRPDIDTDIQQQVEHLVQWEQEYIDVVGYALQESIDRVKSMTGVRRRHLPRMMRLV